MGTGNETTTVGEQQQQLVGPLKMSELQGWMYVMYVMLEVLPTRPEDSTKAVLRVVNLEVSSAGRSSHLLSLRPLSTRIAAGFHLGMQLPTDWR